MKNSKVTGTKKPQKSKIQNQTKEVDIFLVANAKQPLQGFIVVDSHDRYGKMIPNRSLPQVRVEWEKRISGKDEDKNGKVSAFEDSVTLASAWLSAQGCVKRQDRAELLALAKSVFKSFDKLGHLPVALLVRQRSTQSIVELIAVSDEIDLTDPGTVEDYGDVILAFRGDANVTEHFVEVVHNNCGLNGHTCVGAILYTNKASKPK